MNTETKPQKMFVIVGSASVPINPEDEVQFVGIDYSSGGYPYWTSLLSKAKIFYSMDDTVKMLKSNDFVTSNKMSSGKTFPPRMLHELAGLNINKTNGEVSIYIAEVSVKQTADILTFKVRLPD
jgi:hypothetical protein